MKKIVTICLLLFLGRTFAWWTPAPSTTWQIQYSGTIDTSYNVTMYDIDLFDTDQSVIDELHQQNRIVICYFSAGSYENWRPDKDKFPPSVIGNAMQGWPGENWLDIRQISILGPIMEARLDLAVQKKCDGVDPDNVNGYEQNTGFSLSSNDQIQYNVFIAQQSHKRDISVGLKNDVDQLEELVQYFDWAVNEQCYDYDECDGYSSTFIQSNKPVFGIEYDLNVTSFCPQANHAQFSFVKKNMDLDAWVSQCWQSV